MISGKKQVKFMCTAFRDGFQSVYGARVKTKDFLPAVEAAKEAGINWFEAGGGARFQSLYFYCNEDAFDMMDEFRKTAGDDADLQTLARGTNVVGLESQSSDVIKLHADMFAKHGISTIRNFDALNDVNNLIYSGKCIADAGLKHQVSVTMMGLPPGCSGAHDADFYAETLKKILDAEIPFDSVCFKDASGTSFPKTVYETIKKARKILPEDTMIHYHSHETAGTCVAMYLAALEGGADALDLSMAPVSGGSCQVDIVTMWQALRGTDFNLDIDIEKVLTAEEVFKDCMKEYFLPPEATKVEPTIPWSPMPGGALTANTQMLRDNNLMDKYQDISKAMGEVVRKGGFGTSVTPVSQFYFQQAFNNVMFGPWKKIAEGYGKMVLGYFGKTPTKPDSEVVKLASQQLGLEPTDKTPLEINDADETKGLKVAEKRLKDANLKVTDENLFISATCKDKGIAFLKGEAKEGIRYKKDEEKPKQDKADGYTVKVGGKEYAVKIDGNKANVNGKSYDIDIKEGAKETKAPSKPQAKKEEPKKTPSVGKGGDVDVVTPMPGSMWKILLDEGDEVEEGEPIMILEAMKMEIEVPAPCDGVVKSININEGDTISADQVLAVVGSEEGDEEPVSKQEEKPQEAKQAKADSQPQETKSGEGQAVVTPMPGSMWKILLDEGDEVEEGEPIMILEAMKMEIEVPAPCDGVVKSIEVAEGDQISADQILAYVG